MACRQFSSLQEECLRLGRQAIRFREIFHCQDHISLPLTCLLDEAVGNLAGLAHPWITLAVGRRLLSSWRRNLWGARACMTRRLADHFSRLAKAKGYVARSAFKLLEMQQRFKIVRPGSHVLDLGCSPGAWLQVACQHLGHPAQGGCIVGVDIQPCAVPKAFCDGRVRALQADARALAPGQLTAALPDEAQAGFHAVLSDMCHSTVGYAVADVARSLGLARCAAAIALGDAAVQEEGGSPPDWAAAGGSGVLLPGGHLVVKLLQGAGSEEFQRHLRRHFEKVAWVQPRAIRPESREIYLVGMRRVVRS